ncbi:uncharacterized protein LOC116200765 [Punica granatum]|uniref:Uncharacterized protein n=2 Tax=Punica granatum TaxID=22663 RepID=A0A2I0JVN4_PUNGR|nr:uncharacterized protein LOC116200765 [Punica granatum]PKI59923.1 hypothetical protein CRG98_019696 [Punica granatum]
MRGTIGRRLPYCSSSFTSNASARQTLVLFSTSSSGGGGGRGRGRGGPARFEFTVPDDESSSTGFDLGAPAPGKPFPEDDAAPPGLGHGRGRPAPASPTLPSFSSFVATVGRGRGRAQQPPADSDFKKPIFFKKEEGPPKWAAPPSDAGISEPPAEAKEEGLNRKISAGIISALSGAGRGKTVQQPGPEHPVEENRHLGPRPPGAHSGVIHRNSAKRTVGILSGDGPEGSTVSGRGGGGRGRWTGFQGGRGFRGRGQGRGAFGRGGRGGASRERWERDAVNEDSKEGSEDEDGLYLGNKADGEEFANRMGVERMNMLTEAFEEIGDRVLPSPAIEQHLDAFHTNCLIEFEPEYLMEEFGTNPDIDEKPPIPLREALEKMKPFLMKYEGIESQEEWEEVVKATMDQVPLMKEIVDYYSGPDRVTAKQQQQELERVAKTIPQSAPASVKRFADRAVLTLQSNPGWGFDKKCQFMDKVVWEVSQQYK